MSKRSSLALVLMPVLLTALLLLLGQTMSVSGSELGSPSLSQPMAPLLQLTDEVEPNDTIVTANPIDVNTTLAGTIPLSQTGDVDWYRLIVPTLDLGRDYRATLEELVSSTYYRLQLNLYDHEGSLLQSESGTSNTTLDWTSSVITYYLRVEATTFDTNNAPGDADYDLTIVRFAADPTNTPTATPVSWDSCEVNDDPNGDWSADTWPGGPCQLYAEVAKTGLNFMPFESQTSLDKDYFTFLAKSGRTYLITTDVYGGADTEMWLLDENNNQVAYDDDGGSGVGSRIEVQLGDGNYKILVQDRLESANPSTSQTYDIEVQDTTTPTSTPTRTPEPGTGTPTPVPPSIPGSPDSLEPNYSFERASLIGLDRHYINLNFVPWTGLEDDTDFFKLWVASGRLYTCETFDLGTATNTNMIFCSGPSQEQCFAGNDDVQPFDSVDPYRSRLTFFASYDGYLYLMLGQVGAEQILPEEWKNLAYSLRCYIDMPGTATPTPTSSYIPPTPWPTATPSVQEATPGVEDVTPTASATSSPRLVVRPMTSPAPPSALPPAATPLPRLYSIEMSLYYDENGNGQADSGEGISDVLARAHDAISGGLLSVDYTDETGSLRFTVPAEGPVRVSVPFFGFNQVVTTTDAYIQIRIAPRP